MNSRFKKFQKEILKPWQNKKGQMFVEMHSFLILFLNFNQLPAAKKDWKTCISTKYCPFLFWQSFSALKLSECPTLNTTSFVLFCRHCIYIYASAEISGHQLQPFANCEERSIQRWVNLRRYSQKSFNWRENSNGQDGEFGSHSGRLTWKENKLWD